MDIGNVNSTFLWLKLVLTTVVVAALATTLVFIPPSEIPGIWVLLLLYAVLIFRLNRQLRGDRMNWFWLIAALCVPVIGVLISYACISRAVISARKRSGAVI